MNENKDPSIAVDVGLSARATVEAKVSTEIPAESTGRFLNAITDMFRPFSERRGLKADQIRLQREDILIEIAKKARRRLEIENQQVSPLPNRFLVPFLEKASLEEQHSVLIDRWADLLVSCSIDPSSAHPRFVQILSELTEKEARLLRRIALNNIEQTTPNDIMYSELDPTLVTNALSVDARSMLNDDPTEAAVNEFQRRAITLLSVPGVTLMYMFLVKREVNKIRTFNIKDIEEYVPIIKYEDHNIEIDVLSSLSLVRQEHVELSHEKFLSIQVSYVRLTPLAATLLRKCDRDLDHRFRVDPQ